MLEERCLGCGENSGPPLKRVASQPSGLGLSYPEMHPLSVSIPEYTRVCLGVHLDQSLRASSNISSWQRARGAEYGEGLISIPCNQSGHNCNEWKGRRETHRGSPTLQLRPPPQDGVPAWRGQDGAVAAAAAAQLLSRVQLHLSKAPSLRGFPQFSPVLPTSMLLSLEKDDMRGTRGCKTPQIGLEACAGGKKGLRGAGGAWVFSLFSEPPNSPRLASPPGPLR